MGESLVFEQASEHLDKLVGVEVGAKQIERVAHHYGQLLEEASLDEKQDQARAKEKELHYAMVDGAMLLTREEGYKEIKLGRVFKHSTRICVSGERHQLKESEYVAHLGKHEEFLAKLSFKTDSKSALVFIADGARWIWDWVESSYPACVQILDYFHAKQKLCEFAVLAIKEENLRGQWVQQQQELLFCDQVETVMANVALHECKAEAKEKQSALLTYYQNNKERMRYGRFQQQGLLIGSGAIEAAHRSVIQQRLKLSGQRWTKKGVQQIANLRVAKKSNQWYKILQLIQPAA